MFGVDGEGDARLRVVPQQRRVGDRLVTQLLIGVGGVRNQLAQKDGLVRIDGVHHQVQELGDVGLECAAFGAGLLRCSHGAMFPEIVFNRPPDGKNAP